MCTNDNKRNVNVLQTLVFIAVSLDKLMTNDYPSITYRLLTIVIDEIRALVVTMGKKL